VSIRRASLETQFGPLCVTQTGGSITHVTWEMVVGGESSVLGAALKQLKAYTQGELQEFDLPLHVDGPPLVQAVCEEMRKIPYGQTRTYGEIAKTVNASAQAVGQACGRNPIPVIIPCHRVVGAGGKLTGFSGAGGIETKLALLRHEGAGWLI
jgi:methylated-DNA-[protein]-cysteine S-methyltransferase